MTVSFDPYWNSHCEGWSLQEQHNVVAFFRIAVLCKRSKYGLEEYGICLWVITIGSKRAGNDDFVKGTASTAGQKYDIFDINIVLSEASVNSNVSIDDI